MHHSWSPSMSSTIRTPTEYRVPLKSGYSLHACTILHSDCDDNLHDVIVVHGGPGLSSHAEVFAGLQHLPSCRSITFYDQLGCGRSDKPKEDMSIYTLEMYVEELEHVVQHRSASDAKLCLLGHSWGGQVVLEYLLSSKINNNVNCAIVSNAPLDEGAYQKRQLDLRRGLDPDIRAFLEQDEQESAKDGSIGSAIYKKLIGVSDTNITGDMQDWSALSRLPAISVPTLFLTSPDDTVDFENYPLVDHYDHCTSVMLQEGAGHGPFFGASCKEYFCAISPFLTTCS